MLPQHVWTSQGSGTANSLLGASFIDNEHGWAVGGAGTILSTSDGGRHWSPQNSGTGETLMSVSFVDRLHGWAVGTNGTIVVSADGGVTWTAQNSSTLNRLESVAFADAVHGWAVGVSTILATTDGGVTWQAQSGPPTPSWLRSRDLHRRPARVGRRLGRCDLPHHGWWRNVDRTIDGHQ